MAMKEFEKGTVIYESGQPLEKLYLIARGMVRASFSGGSFVLKNGDIIGLSDINYKETFIQYEAIEKCMVMEYAFSDGEINSVLNNNKDATKYFLTSLFHQLSELIGQYKLIKNEFSCLKDYLVTGYDDYKYMCEKISISPAELADFDDVINFDFEEFLPEWITEYYTALKDIVMESDEGTNNPAFITGLITKSGKDIRQMVTLNGEIEANKADILNLLINENSVDLFEMYLSLYIKAVKKLGLDDSTVGQIYRAINDIMMQAETQGVDEKSFYSIRKRQYDETMKLATELSANRDAELEIYGNEQLENLKESLKKILEFSEIDPEYAKDFEENVQAYKKTVNKNGSEDDIRRLRSEITKQFNEIYIQAFEIAAEHDEIPVVLKMFFNFGYVDEELAGLDNAVYLYDLVNNMPTDPEKGVYSYYEWLMAIYNCKKDPGRNEFDTDYADYLHEQMRNQRISKAQEQAMFKDPLYRVRYELENVFPSVNKTTTGRITTFCPLFSEHNILKPLENMIVSEKAVTEIINNIRSIDFGAYYRQTMYASPEDGITKEFIDIEVLPDIILTPNIGNRGIMWQEIEGKRRTTPARMFCSSFQQEDLTLQLIKLTGQFRWEMCKRVQGARWNDISEHSLTSEYFDYVQYYRKNNDLTPEAKDKIKNDMTRCKNSFREMFIRDYLVWIQYEAMGAPRLNKVARAILFRYIPFSKECRNKLMINPMYKDMIERYETKQKSKLHRLNNVMVKVKNMGRDVPEEIMEQERFLKA